MEFEDVVRNRKMIRKYLSNKIPDSIISKLIKNASRAPSASHTQVQGVYHYKRPNYEEKMRQASVNQKFIEDASLVIEVIQLAFIGLSIAIIIYESKMKKELSGKTASG